MAFDQLSLIQHEDMKCEEAVIATMASYWNIHYEIMFKDRLFFDFIPNKKINLLGDKLNVNYDHNRYDLLEKYHGIIITPSEISEEFILNELKNNHPVMTFFDQYYAPWLQEKDKTEIERHRGYILVLDYNKENNEFICIDVHTSKNIQKIDYQNFFCGCNKHIKSIKHRKIMGHDIDYKNIIKESISLLYTPKTVARNSIDAIRLLAAHVSDLDLNYEFNGYINIFYSPLSEALRNICQNTGLYLLLLEFLKKYDNYGLVDEYYIEMTELCIKWKSMIALIFKNYFKGRFDMDCKIIVRDQILQIAKYFEHTVNSMMIKLAI